MRRLLTMLLTVLVAATLALTATPAHADPGPALQITPAPGGVNGWYAETTTVFVKATATGPSSGVRSVSYEMTGATTATGTVDSNEGGTVTISNSGRTTLTVTAIDVNDNPTWGQMQFGVDRAKPSVIFRGRLAAPDRRFARGEQVLVEYACTDADSGIAACSGTQASGTWLDTSTIGESAVTFTGRDKVGRTQSLSVTYQVVDNVLAVTRGADITGTKTVGQQVEVQAPLFDPTPDEIAYQWTRDGVAIPGATGLSYVVTPEDSLKSLGVRATASRSAWQDRTVVSPGYQVQPAAITVASGPVLTGEAHVVESLRVEHGAVTPSTATISYQWLRDGELIPQAGGRVYFPDYRDIGKRISVRVAATAPGHAEAVWVSAPSDVVRGRTLEVQGVPTVSGEPRAGSLLTAQAPSVRVPLPSRYGEPANVAYQWLSDGAPIAGATQQTYRLTAADVGRRVTVRITATRPLQEGYEPVVLVSIPGPAVGQATPVVTGKAKAKGDQKVKLTVSVSAAGLDPSAPVTVKRGKRVVARGKVTSSGRLVLTLMRQPKGKVTWTVLYAGSQGVEARTIRVSAKVR